MPQRVNSGLLNAEATNFAKANTLSSTVQNATAGPSERELHAQHRQNRFQQPQPEQADAGMANAVGAADITDIEAAASLVDLMAHETLQGKRLAYSTGMPICMRMILHQRHACLEVPCSWLDVCMSREVPTNVFPKV